MDQPIHEHREPPPLPPDSDRDAHTPRRGGPRSGSPPRRGRWPVWKHLVLAGVLVVVGVVATITPWYLLATWPRPQAETSGYLFQMHQTMYNATLEGATLDEARALARAEGFEGSVAGSTIRVNPDSAIWAGHQTPYEPDEAPIMLVADRRFGDCTLLPEGRGRAGHYGYTARWELCFIPEGELPEWARP